jgi:hypothetical protein
MRTLFWMGAAASSSSPVIIGGALDEMKRAAPVLLKSSGL